MNETTNGSYFILNVNRDFAVVSMVFQTFFLVVGVPANALVCFFTFRKKKDIKLSDIIISMLAISDGLYTIVRASIGRTPVYPTSTISCRIEVGLPLYFGIVNIYCMTVLAVTRYIAIVTPQRMITVRRRHGILIISLLTWTLPLIFTLPQIFGYWGGFSYTNGLGICLGVYHYSQGFLTGSYYICLILFVVQFPTLIIGWCYHQIYLEVKRSRLRISQFRSSTEHDDPSASSHSRGTKRNITISGNQGNRSSRRREPENRKAEIAIAKTLVIIFVTFQISFMPYSVVSFYNFISHTSYTVLLQLGLLFVTYIGNVANPYIFLFRSDKFQKFCNWRLMKCCQKGRFNTKVRPVRLPDTELSSPS
ncbi:uncharacterized protein TRIADDRAFT_52295 [Trichoplax adhaerens]|uniref:G-protein coupled receptors family 1 profile domain-containing protein n=1 Tax=Trichoplax adhaerens TaxID=10228 RepID=B3RMA6_TRIAD|nr:hypothetical protein TRIADDRAFT_52295 [Trichoplax adhaerens]EDV28931.1 hypothetical protein TRIADDRAFT_52295 [Trichoplax adhaerens]|eukprot:XP_002108133.1 hypothetical protein TRIADDRAFT_52295 [Trichoplax adhaerens]